MILADLRMERIMLSNKPGLRRRMTRTPLAFYHDGRNIYLCGNRVASPVTVQS